MIYGYSPIFQALLGTLFTWFLTAVGASLVFFLPGRMTYKTQKKVLDFSLGFAAGVMIAASFWSLLAPAIEIAEHTYGKYAFVPAVIGVIAGALFVYVAEQFLPDTQEAIIEPKFESPTTKSKTSLQSAKIDVRQRRSVSSVEEGNIEINSTSEKEKEKEKENSFKLLKQRSWRRILLMVLAITVHNFPEGLAVGVGFGAVGEAGHDFYSARSLAIGIGLQNFPEGLAVSLPLHQLGYSPFKAFWYGQLSGMVEPLAGVFGAAAMQLSQPLLPYALAFAAGAMLLVVAQELIPEANTGGNPHIASFGFMFGFLVMMTLDVTLG